MTRIESVAFDVTSYKPSQELSKLLDDLAKSANTLVMHITEVGIILNEIVSRGRKDGLLDIQIRELIDLVLGENRTIRKYLPKELKKHNYPERRKRIVEEIGTDSNIDSNSLIEDASAVESLEEIPRRYEPENSLPENEWQGTEALHNKIKEQEQLINDLRKTLSGKDKLLAESESRLTSEAQKVEMLRMQFKDYTNNLRETPEFQKATRQIEIAYEDQINTRRSECEKAKEKYHDINGNPKTIEFSPKSLGCIDLILENRDGILYLLHDGLKVIGVTAVKPTGGEEIVN